METKLTPDEMIALLDCCLDPKRPCTTCPLYLTPSPDCIFDLLRAAGRMICELKDGKEA